MGYNTEFFGSFELDRELEQGHLDQLVHIMNAKSGTLEGAPPGHCQWGAYGVDDSCIEWSGEENFEYYVEWLEYFDNLFKKFGYTLNNTVCWRGEEFEDIGAIVVKDNVVKVVDFTDIVLVELDKCD